MIEDGKPAGFLTELGQQLRAIPQEAADGWRRWSLQLRNDMRRLRGARVEYIVMPVGGVLPERSEPPRSFLQRQLPLPPRPLSLQTLNSRFRQIADAGNVTGVVLQFEGFGSISLARLQNLRTAIQRLREAGKTVIVYTSKLDLPHYYAAAAANAVIAPPSAEFTVLGLAIEAQFLKDALAKIGVQADVVQISPYKSALDQVGKADMSPELREQYEWLLDDLFGMVTADIAADRGLELNRLLELIDGGPYFAATARDNGLLDYVGYLDDLPTILRKEQAAPPAEASDSNAAPAENDQAEASPPETEDPRPQARLQTWAEARPLLLEKYRKIPRRHVTVIALEGAIVDGVSQNPPVDLPIPLIGGISAGDQTITALLRRAERDDQMAALLFYVDSPGGSALASDLIMRDLKRLSQKVPVVAYMGGTAASGGYYVSAPAGHIMAQRATLTGSIGVVNARFSTTGLLERLSINQASVQRGKHARLYRSNEPMSEEEYARFWSSITEIYAQFKQVVAEGRDLALETLDPICEGRVWTGRQAVDHQLVDSHGDFLDALRKAAELGDLPVDDEHHIPVRTFFPGGRTFELPRPFEAAETALQLVLNNELRRYSGRTLMLMPVDFRLQ